MYTFNEFLESENVVDYDGFRNDLASEGYDDKAIQEAWDQLCVKFNEQRKLEVERLRQMEMDQRRAEKIRLLELEIERREKERHKDRLFR